jgi:hypothetical protein
MSDATVYAIYGIQVQDGASWRDLDQMVGPCMNDGKIGWIHLGARGRHDTYLIIKWTTKEPGEPVWHSGEAPNADKTHRDRWNGDLRTAAHRLGLEIVNGPGWCTVASEG